MIKGQRSSGREEALKILYFIEKTFTEQNSSNFTIESIVNDYEKIHPCDSADIRSSQIREFALSLVREISDNKEDIDKKIDKYSKNRRIERIDVITLSILRLGICQFIYFKDIPPKVVINECVSLSKLYEEDEKTPSFINGILDSIFHEKITG